MTDGSDGSRFVFGGLSYLIVRAIALAATFFLTLVMP